MLSQSFMNDSYGSIENLETDAEGLIAGSVKDPQSITSDWEYRRPLINGVAVKEVKNVPKENGALTEIYRADWGLDDKQVAQIFQVTIAPGGITAWHSHQHTTDRLFASFGTIKIVLFDARAGSPTMGMILSLIHISEPTRPY